MSTELNTETDVREYDTARMEAKWPAVWDALNVYVADNEDTERERFTVVDMFPYPSGDLHMGHAEAYAMGDVVARYWMHRGKNVLHPVGWDSFGLPAENAAIKRNAHPSEWTYANIETQAKSFRRYALSLDWSRRLQTSDPEYYRWTQWLFKRFYERGLAYRKNSPVNWCPKDQTVLANEQVVNGACERCGTMVTKKNLNQWYFKITDYADRLLDDMDQLEGQWPERVLLMQRNWIGRSVGAHVTFQIPALGEMNDGDARPEASVTVFTTRPDTLFGATFMVVAADSDLALELVAPSQRAALEEYRESIKTLSDIDRQSSDREKTGVPLGRVAINPVSGEEIPVWASDYVLADYGTGAIMSVPAHDQRDLDFARAFDLPIRMVVDTGEEDPAVSGVATTGDGVMVNSGPLDGLNKQDAIAAATELVESRGTGEATVNYRLRDWLLSRQRFWGAPIPIIHCEIDGEVPVPDNQLPVELPTNLRGEQLAPKGESPLASATDWVNVTCPICGGPARRDTDTMDTFVDSSWYFLRYASPRDDKEPFAEDQVNKWLPVDQYVGGVEHAILHLLYARFFTKVLFDMGMVNFTEPFKALLNQGQVLNQGKAMSKSLGNGVDLSEELDRFGVDSVRMAMVFASPPADDVDWADVSPAAMGKFLARAWRVARDVKATGVPASEGNRAMRSATHKAVHDSAQLVESGKFNVVIARAMELVNVARKFIDDGNASDPAAQEAAEAIAILLSLFAPYTAEDMWELLGHEPSIARAPWPEVDESLLVEDTVTAVVQIQGKVRERLEVSPEISASELEALALASDGVKRFLDGRGIRKVIVREPKLVNIVPE